MKQHLNVTNLFRRFLVLLPLVYITFGWYVGLNYSRKPVILGPYSDIPVVMKTSLFGSPLKEISGARALVIVSPPEETGKDDSDSTYFKIPGYFELPGVWWFDGHVNGIISLRAGVLLTGSHLQAIAHELKHPERNLGYLSLDELSSFLKSTNKVKDLRKLKPYLFLARLEQKYPHLYSESVLLSPVMGNVFLENWIPYDTLGLVGIAVLFVALAIRRLWLWLYYLYWVFAYWFGRIGFYNPNLAFSQKGWQIIFWSFWHGFIQKEGRLFLVIVFGLSVIVFGAGGLIYLAEKGRAKKCRCRI